MYILYVEQREGKAAVAPITIRLGMMYLEGDGIPKNAEEAVKWFRIAADQEFPAALYNLGLCYATGKGVKKNRSEAKKWFRKAAELGNASAQRALESF